MFPSGAWELVEGVRELEPVGNALCGVPAQAVVPRNATEGVPYRDFRRLEFPDALGEFPFVGGPLETRVSGKVS